MQLLELSTNSLEQAATALRDGAIVAYPTETVYGLGVDPFNPTALERLFTAKGRDRDQAVLLIVADDQQLQRVAAVLSPRARAYMDAFWPGPLSLLMPRHPSLPEALAPGKPKICVRCPGSNWARALCTTFGGPITSTSANRSGEPPVTELQKLQLPGVALGLDAGPLESSAVSTILDADTGEILRPGAITAEQLHSIHV